MQNRRLVLSVFIKLLIFLGLFLLVLVFVNSLFTEDSSVKQNTEKSIPLVSLDTDGMYSGQIKKTRWNNREVGVLFRQAPEKLNQASAIESQVESHSSIKNSMRSQSKEYFVYFNIGDSSNCPLFYAAGVFKDVCSLNTFDEAGRSITANSQQFKLKIPPHHFKNGNLIIGEW